MQVQVLSPRPQFEYKIIGSSIVYLTIFSHLSMRKIEDISEQEAIRAFELANSKSDIAGWLGINYSNRKVIALIDEIAVKFKLSFDHLYKINKKRKYLIINKICPVCSKSFEAQQGHKKEKKVCSRACSNILFSEIRHTEKSRKKVSDTLKSYHRTLNPEKFLFELEKIECPQCKIFFLRKKRKQSFCSLACVAQWFSKNPETIEKSRTAHKKLVAEGKNKGWAHRNKFTRSYAENYVEEILNKMNFFRSKEFEIEHKQHLWFIDFAFLEKKIALEIDGRQHRLPERKASDERKDAWLTANDWTVCRIKWRKPNKEFRDEIENTLKDLLK